MKADGSRPKRLIADACAIRWPAVSPDGRFIVFGFDSDSDCKGKENLWRIDQDGGNPQQLALGDIVYPHVSPDSQWVYYAAQRHDKWSLWKVPITGGEPSLVVEPQSGRPAISPNGRLLAYTYLDEQLKRRRVAVRSLVNGALLKTFDARIGYDTLRWMRDSGGIAYSGANEIVVRLLTGGAPRLLLKAADERIFSFDITRDGQSVAYLSGRITDELILIRDFLPNVAGR
jgi:Tol biopolymer transport system component